ncbi:MAG: hypothetical protein SGJ24_12155 [Chloroflexota bacterium]|nr:hypothetical protein [Chloroflexota bacterium]
MQTTTTEEAQKLIPVAAFEYFLTDLPDSDEGHYEPLEAVISPILSPTGALQDQVTLNGCDVLPGFTLVLQTLVAGAA